MFCLFLQMRNMYIIAILLLGLAKGSMVHENVVFHKTNEITLSRSKWLVTFVIDLEPYERVMERLSEDITKIVQTNRQILTKYVRLEQTTFGHHFIQLGQEIRSMRDTYEGIIQSYTEYKSLQGGRHKRSLLPFIGKALHFLFGTASDSELNAIKRNVRTLAKNQATIIHVLEDSLTLLNTSRVQISENRQTINTLIIGLNEFEARLGRITEEIYKRINQIETFLNTYLQVDLIMEEIKQIINRVTFYLEHLQLQLNMLSLRRLAPSTITPNNLKQLLSEIEDRLPPNLRLPGDPNKDLWKFYQMLTCTTILENNRILVIIPIPLLEANSQLEIYQVHNLPVPMMRPEGGQDSHSMTAQYTLESAGLAIDVKRTKFALLDSQDINACSSRSLGFCPFKSPLYPVNTNRFCIVSLFTADTQAIQKTCQTRVMLRTILPMAKVIANGVWAISTNTPLHLNVICPNKPTTTITVAPPLSLIKLNKSCSATSNELFLTPYFEEESSFADNDKLISWVRNYALTNMTLWRPLRESLPVNTSIVIPKQLKSLEQVPLGHFIRELRQLNTIEQKQGHSWWKYLAVGTLGALVLSIVGVVGYVFYFKRIGLIRSLGHGAFARWLSTKEDRVVTDLASASGKPEDADDVNRGDSTSAPMINDRDDTARVKFYP